MSLAGMPNEQVLERCPIPDSNFLMVCTGQMVAPILEANHAVHLISALVAVGRQRHRLRGVFLVLDGGGSQIAGRRGWWRPRRTPAHASCLDQGEILNHASGLRSLNRASWTGRAAEYIAHMMASSPEYNRLYAHPFEWTWTNQKLRRSFAEHAPWIPCIIDVPQRYDKVPRK
jgi:hypothetical protein